MDCDMRPSRGGHHQPDTPGGGYWPGLAPKSLLRNGGQRPFIHRLQHCPPALGDGASAATHRGLGQPKGEGLRLAAGAPTAAPGAGGIRSVRAHNQLPRSAVEPPRDGPAIAGLGPQGAQGQLNYSLELPQGALGDSRPKGLTISPSLQNQLLLPHIPWDIDLGGGRPANVQARRYFKKTGFLYEFFERFRFSHTNAGAKSRVP